MKIYYSWAFEIDTERGIPENMNVFIQTPTVTHRESITNPQEVIEYLEKETKNLSKKFKKFVTKSDLIHKEGSNEKGNSEARNIAESNGVAARPARGLGRGRGDGK